MKRSFVLSYSDISEMKNKQMKSTLLPLVIIPVGGLIALGICYFLYLLLYNFVEIQFFRTNPTSLPADLIRRVYALLLIVLYFALFRTKISDVIMASILAGPMGIFFTTLILTLYEKTFWAIITTVVVVAFSAFLLKKIEKPWVFYYAIAITVLVSIALAWPEA